MWGFSKVSDAAWFTDNTSGAHSKHASEVTIVIDRIFLSIFSGVCVHACARACVCARVRLLPHRDATCDEETTQLRDRDLAALLEVKQFKE